MVGLINWYFRGVYANGSSYGLLTPSSNDFNGQAGWDVPGPYPDQGRPPGLGSGTGPMYFGYYHAPLNLAPYTSAPIFYQPNGHDCYRTDTPLNGQFANNDGANSTSFEVLLDSSGASAYGNIYLRFLKGTAPDGSNATQINFNTNYGNGSGIFVFAINSQTIQGGTLGPISQPLSFNNEYLFCQIECAIGSTTAVSTLYLYGGAGSYYSFVQTNQYQSYIPPCTINGTGNLIGTLRGGGSFATISSSASLSGSIHADGYLHNSINPISAFGTLIPGLVANASITETIHASGTLITTANSGRALNDVMIGTGFLSSNIQGSIRAYETIAATSSQTAALNGIGHLSDTISATSSLFLIQGARFIQTLIPAISNEQATLIAHGLLSELIAASSSSHANINANGILLDIINSLGSMTASGTMKLYLRSTIASQGFLLAVLRDYATGKDFTDTLINFAATCPILPPTPTPSLTNGSTVDFINPCTPTPAPIASTITSKSSIKWTC